MPKKNTAYGDNALKNNKSNQNSAFGFEALELNTMGYQNTVFKSFINSRPAVED